MNGNIEHKQCDCPDVYWEEITAKEDDGRTLTYYHCDNCGEDFRVEDFATGEEVIIK